MSAARQNGRWMSAAEARAQGCELVRWAAPDPGQPDREAHLGELVHLPEMHIIPGVELVNAEGKAEPIVAATKMRPMRIVRIVNPWQVLVRAPRWYDALAMLALLTQRWWRKRRP